MALGSTQPLMKTSTRYIPGGKGDRCVRLTTSPPSGAECHEIRQPKPSGTLWATPGLLRDSFIFIFTFEDIKQKDEKSRSELHQKFPEFDVFVIYSCFQFHLLQFFHRYLNFACSETIYCSPSVLFGYCNIFLHSGYETPIFTLLFFPKHLQRC
jgi:hypothetical protein